MFKFSKWRQGFGIKVTVLDLIRVTTIQVAWVFEFSGSLFKYLLFTGCVNFVITVQFM